MWRRSLVRLKLSSPRPGAKLNEEPLAEASAKHAHRRMACAALALGRRVDLGEQLLGADVERHAG